MSNTSDRPHSPLEPRPFNPLPIELTARWERPLVPREGGEATLLVRVTAPDRAPSRSAPLDVAFVLDRSGSMHGGKLDLAKEGVSLAMTGLRDVDRVALVVYDDQVATVQPLAAATPRLKSSLRLALPGIDPGGSTFLSGGWVAGCQALAEAPAPEPERHRATRVRRVILLTDGLANVGILDPRELARHAGELRRRGIATTTVGVGLDFDEGLLSAMAEAGGGNFQYTADAAGLRDFFSQELQELFRVAVTELTVTLALPPGVDAELVSAFPLERRGNGLAVAIGDVPAGDEIDLIFTVRAGHGTEGDRLHLGIAASWTAPHLDARQGAELSIPPLRRASSAAIADSEPDPFVTERSALQRAAAERRAGLEADRAGRFAASRAHMRKAHEHLLDAPDGDDVRFELVETFSLAEAPDDAAYGPDVRKTAQYREALRRRGRLSHEPGPAKEERSIT